MQYGKFGFRGGVVRAHRMAFMLSFGDIPDGMFALHKCDNPKCVRPSHLKLGNHLDNMADMSSSGRAASGELNPSSKLNHYTVYGIRKDRKLGMTFSALSAKYLTCISNVHKIIHNKTWIQKT